VDNGESRRVFSAVIMSTFLRKSKILLLVRPSYAPIRRRQETRLQYKVVSFRGANFIDQTIASMLARRKLLNYGDWMTCSYDEKVFVNGFTSIRPRTSMCQISDGWDPTICIAIIMCYKHGKFFAPVIPS
jgi:hypothetical protein